MLPEEAINEVKKTEPVEQPVPPEKAEPADELVVTMDEFFTSMTKATQRSMRSMLGQFMKKADAAIAKLDEAAGGAPPKKP